MNRMVKVGLYLSVHAIQTLEFCDADVYPNLRKLLAIFATFPVTTASSERSFSTMRRLKTYLRCTMGEQRLTSLALLSVHRDRPVDKDSVLNEYAVSSNRRSDFLL